MIRRGEEHLPTNGTGCVATDSHGRRTVPEPDPAARPPGGDGYKRQGVPYSLHEQRRDGRLGIDDREPFRTSAGTCSSCDGPIDALTAECRCSS